MHWSVEASEELLRLRFRGFRTLFDDAQTVADVHEAWGVVASALNATETLELELQVDAVKCSDQLTRLRQQWQDNSRMQLHPLMVECFGQREQSSTFNRAMEETIPTPLKRQKTMETTETDAASDEEVPPSPELATVSPDAASPEPNDSPPCQDKAMTPPEQAADVEQETTCEEFPRQVEIMRALEKRSEQLERLAKSHQHLADVTQELMEALVNREGMS